MDNDPFFEQDLSIDCGLDFDNLECQNLTTLEPPEIRLKDIVFSKLIYQGKLILIHKLFAKIK